MSRKSKRVELKPILVMVYMLCKILAEDEEDVVTSHWPKVECVLKELTKEWVGD